MKKYRPFLGLAFVVSVGLAILPKKCGAQVFYNTESTDSTNVYRKAFMEFEDHVRKQFPKVREIFLEKSIISTTWLAPTSRAFVIRLIHPTDVDSVLGKPTIGVSYTRITPLRYENGYFFINIIAFEIEHLGNRDKFVNHGALTVRFNFDCEARRFLFYDTQGGFDDFH